jgi:lauroyl/myristoyl acyltransferase
VSLPRGAAWFAHRTGVPIYMGFAVRAPDDSFILRMHPPIDPVAAGSEEAIQDQIVAIMEETIARDPCQWFIFDPFWSDAPPNSAPQNDPGNPSPAIPDA